MQGTVRERSRELCHREVGVRSIPYTIYVYKALHKDTACFLGRRVGHPSLSKRLDRSSGGAQFRCQTGLALSSLQARSLNGSRLPGVSRKRQPRDLHRSGAPSAATALDNHRLEVGPEA